ncbi:MAG: hypothetical protein ACI9QA_000180 [Methanobacteriota archaeon]
MTTASYEPQVKMTEEDAEKSASSPITDSRLRLVYVAGIALNLIALYGAVTADEWLFAVTFMIILIYISIRYWMVARSTLRG